MKYRNNFWKGLLACAALVVMSTAAFAVTDGEIARLKGMIEQGQAFTQADFELAQEINATTQSYIDLEQAKRLMLGLPALADQPRRPAGHLDDYSWSETDYEWVDITGVGTVAVNADDINEGPFDLGFTVNFFNTDYSSVRLCSNGFVSFTSATNSLGNGAIPNPVEPNAVIYGFWDDLNPGAGGDVYYYADAANDRFIVAWVDVPHYSSTTEFYTYEVIINASGTIVINYNSITEEGANGNISCTVGIENADGTQALQVANNGTGTLPTDELAIMFSQEDGVPNAPTNVVATPNGTTVNFTWTDPDHDTNGNPLTPSGIQIWQGPAGTGTLLGTAGAGVQAFSVTDLQSGNYTFNVRAAAGAFFSSSVQVTAVVGNPSYFSDFEADDGSLISDNGWAWGTPTGVGPATAHSGTRVWGTVLDANYPINACYNLDINQELTVGSDAATLEFWMWYDTEGLFDGMNIKVSVDGGTTWDTVPTTAVTPAYTQTAFSTANTCMPSEAGWDGHTHNSWTYYVVNLGAYVGQTPIIRFHFGSDPSIIYPGMYIDDVTLWGFGEPVFAPVSGTVTLDGGAGTMTAVNVTANGIGNPTAHPLANGTYSLAQVLVGNRRVTATFAGYHDAIHDFTLTEGGSTGINLTLTRLDPPVPTNLTGGVVDSTGVVTLNWDDSPDPLVDVYPVYRRLQGDPNWVLQGTPTGSTYQQTLTVPGIYQYAVSARDNNVSVPVESDMTGAITVLYGALPITSIGANGNFDDRIALSWLTPGISEGTEISYDDGTSEVWYRVATPNTDDNYFCQRMSPPDDATFPLMLYAATVYMERSDPLPWVALCPPNGTNTGADLDNPLYEWTDIGADSTPGWLYAETDGSVFLDAPGDFYIVIQFPPGATGPGCGSDNSAPDGRAYWTWPATMPTWNAFPSYDWMMRAWVGGPPPEELRNGRDPQTIELYSIGEPSGYATDRVPQRTITVPLPSTEAKDAKQVRLAQAKYESQRGFANPLDQWFPPYSRAPEVGCSIGRERGRSLDDITNYRVYRQGTGQIAQVAATVHAYTDLNRIENTNYTYWVTALYDGTQESPESPHVTRMCNMAPAAPSGLVANALGTNQMALAWVAPTLNADGSALVDLAGYRVYRNGTQIGTTAAGVTTYTDTPPDNQTFYTWTVTAVDEVPNISDPSPGVIGAVQSPWEITDYDWVDISTIGTAAGITGDDQNVGPFDLGFTINYYGNDYSSVYMCSNGWASFTSTSTVYTNTEIPNAAEPNNSLFAWWDDMYPPTGGGEYYYYQDTANDRFIMSWINEPHISNANARFTYQMIIDSRGGITYNYNLVPTPDQAPGVTSGTIGVENADGTEAIEVLFNGTGAFTPANQTAIAFWAGPSGAISGLVREFGSNAPIANAEITAAEAPGEVAFTDAQGNYTLEVEPGTYTVTVHKQGYCDQEFANVVVDDGGTTTRNASMRQPNATFSSSSLNFYTLIGQNSVGTFEITNPNGQCPVSYTITTDQNWLTTSPATGDIDANQSQIITVTGATSAFPAGDYTATVTVNNNDTSVPFVIPVTITMALTADDNVELPTEFALHQNYPNPFNASTILSYDVPQESHVELVLYNVQGQEVARPVNQIMAAGRHSLSYDASNLPTGMYLVRMHAGSFSAVQKIVLLK